MRLWVRPGVRINLSLGFSGAGESTPDTSDGKVLYQPRVTLSPVDLISGWWAVKKKRQRFPGLPTATPSSFMLPYDIHVLVGEY